MIGCIETSLCFKVGYVEQTSNQLMYELFPGKWFPFGISPQHGPSQFLRVFLTSDQNPLLFYSILFKKCSNLIYMLKTFLT
jgi:hypothetical protein